MPPILPKPPRSIDRWPCASCASCTSRTDHLDIDIVGHSTLAGGRTADRLPSGAGFGDDAFDAACDAVAGAIARSSA
ncbi:hypothetical protein [Azohydromonas sediminis]|uniref:hypothetical protein n=1 Tax=Azohydromonas sediminis TaxID=2259674 RepID=UPI000E65D5B6|nr:hypothetical protein [Azohydromonas sediminis]